MCDCYGIDLGTTFSSCSYYFNGKLECMDFSDNKKKLRSFVSYEKDKIVVGESAYNTFGRNKKDGFVLYDSKRLIGNKNDDFKDDYFKNCPFKIEMKDGLPFYYVDNKLISPIDVSSEIIKWINERAKIRIPRINNKEIKDVVITVPAYFKSYERKLTKLAGEKAGLNIIGLLNEPTAAAIAYIYQNNEIEGQTLIYDFGGGTFDVSIIEVFGNNITVLKSNGCNKLGGQDLTNILLNYVIKISGIKIDDESKTGKSKLSKLKKKVEESKILLSSTEEIEIEVDSSNDINVAISRSKFEEICNDLFNKTIEIVDKTIKELGDKRNIKRIILVGGSSNIPKISEILKEKYKEMSILKTINPNEAVSLGAGYYAYNLKHPEYVKYEINEILTNSIGFSSFNKNRTKQIFIPLLKKGTKLPCSKKIICGNGNYSDSAVVLIYEGEDENLKNDIKLGDITVEIPRRPLNTIKIELHFSINRDGVLNVKVKVDEGKTTIEKSLDINI